MLCPKCGKNNDVVKDSRFVCSINKVRRRRKCLSCFFKFTTYEFIRKDKTNDIT